MTEVAQMRQPEAVHLKCKNDIGAELGAFNLVVKSHNTFDFEAFNICGAGSPDYDRIPGNGSDIIMVAVAVADSDDIGGGVDRGIEEAGTQAGLIGVGDEF